MTEQDITTYAPAPLIRGEDLDDTFRLAKAIALSKRFPDATTAEQALVKILCGRDLGMTPMQSMMGIHIVEGKPMVAAVTLGAFVREIPAYDYRIVELTDEKCAIEFTRDQEVLGVSEFTIEDAKRAGLVKDKSGWVKYPRNMLYARAMSNGVKWFAPDATNGVAVYHEGEIEAQRFVDGSAEPSAEITPAEVTDLADLPADLADRLAAAINTAQEVRPGVVTPAAVQMSVAGQSREAIEAFIERIETANAEAQAEPPDAEVVEATEKQADELGVPVEGVHKVIGTQAELEVKQARLRDLLERRETLEPGSPNLELVDEEIAFVESELAASVEA